MKSRGEPGWLGAEAEKKASLTHSSAPGASNAAAQSYTCGAKEQSRGALWGKRARVGRGGVGENLVKVRLHRPGPNRCCHQKNLSNSRPSPAKPPQPGGARSGDDVRTDQGDVTLRHCGAASTDAGDRRRELSALEEGEWGRNLMKVSPQLAQFHRTTPVTSLHTRETNDCE